jgi:hypothetical protein
VSAPPPADVADSADEEAFGFDGLAHTTPVADATAVHHASLFSICGLGWVTHLNDVRQLDYTR